MTKEQYAYLAGIVDGEGHLAIGRTNYRSKDHLVPTYMMVFTASNTSAELIAWLLNNVGGKVYPKGHYYDAWKQGYTWQLFQKEIKDVCVAILPFVVIKREQVLMLLKYTTDDGRKAGTTGMDRLRIRLKRE